MARYEGKFLWLDGKINIHLKPALLEWLSQFPEDTWFEIAINPIGDINCHAQSKLYFEWCDIMALDLGHDSGQALHEFFKETYNSGRSTKGMDTKEWSIYMTKILAFAGEHNFTLPVGNAEN